MAPSPHVGLPLEHRLREGPAQPGERAGGGDEEEAGPVEGRLAVGGQRDARGDEAADGEDLPGERLEAEEGRPGQDPVGELVGWVG